MIFFYRFASILARKNAENYVTLWSDEAVVQVTVVEPHNAVPFYSAGRGE